MPVINGNRRADDLTGGRGADVLRGRGGADSLDGGGGADRLLGGRGADELRGGRGADQLQGGAGDDVLIGGAGRDRLTGGGGADVFAFGGRWGADTITDFNAAQGDVIDLSATDIDFTDLVIAQTGEGALIRAGRSSILLRGVEATGIDAGFFAFAGGKAGTDTTDSGSDDKVSIDDEAGAVGVLSNAAADLVGAALMRLDARFGGADGSGYTVAVLDTGIDLNHAAFGADANGDGVSDRIVFHQDFSTDRDGSADDVQGHGSHVSSIVASEASAYAGIAPGANIAALQVLDNSGRGGMAGIESALRWVIDNAAAYNIVSVNMSLGGGDNASASRTNAALGDEFAALDALGVIVTVAAGNDFFTHQSAGVSSIAADPNAIAVGAVWAGNFGRVDFGSGAKDFSTAADRVTSFSQRSATMGEIFAPGAMITGAAPGGGFASQAGTSQAAPVIAGMAALAQEIADDVLGRRLTPAEFHALLISTADTIRDGDDEDDNVPSLNADIPRANMLALAEGILAMAGDDPTPGPNPTPGPGTGDDDFGDSVAEATRIRARRDVSGE
ncbi:MAG: S8 family serine peptidase, partial [Pseudomonadota bacterium]|nr:S8 family serine peptidase [Pseudomonadota bacterium]